MHNYFSEMIQLKCACYSLMWPCWHVDLLGIITLITIIMILIYRSKKTDDQNIIRWTTWCRHLSLNSLQPVACVISCSGCWCKLGLLGIIILIIISWWYRSKKSADRNITKWTAWYKHATLISLQPVACVMVILWSMSQMLV